MDQQIAAPALPGLPLRPAHAAADIRQAEQQLVSANAQIGVATALLYPQVTISGLAGIGGATLNGANFGPFGIFSALPAITLPIFDDGRLQANVASTRTSPSRPGCAISETLQQALREVSDALVGIRKRQEIPAAAGTARQGPRGRQRGRQLALRRWGVHVPRSPGYGASALPGATRSGPSEARRVVERDRRYKALGGGWQAEAPVAAALARMKPELRRQRSQAFTRMEMTMAKYKAEKKDAVKGKANKGDGHAAKVAKMESGVSATVGAFRQETTPASSRSCTSSW